MKVSLRTKSIISVSLVIFLFGMIATTVIYVYAKSILVENLKDQLELVVVDKAQDIEVAIGNVRYQAATIAKHKKTIALLEKQDYQSLLDVSDVLSGYNVPELYSAVYIMNKQGLTLASTAESFKNKNYNFRDYFQKAINGTPYVDISLGVTSGKLGYYVSYPVKDVSEEILGVVVIKVRPEVINEYVEHLSELLPHSHVMLVDDNGVVFFSDKEDKLYHSLGALSPEQKEYEESKRFPSVKIEALTYNEIQQSLSPLVAYREFEFFDKHDREEELLGVSKIPLTPFYFIVENEVENYVASAVRFAFILAGFIIISVVTAGLLISFVLLRLLRPLVQLNKGAQEVSRGNYDIHFSTSTGSKETDSLANSFNQMVQSVKDSRATIENRVKRQTEEILKQQEKSEKQRIAILNILEDVGEEKKIAEDLAHDLEKFQLAVSEASDHIVITDADANVLHANKAVEKITGFSVKEVLGTKAGTKDNWGGNMPRKFYDKMWETIRDKKQIFSGEITNTKKWGEDYTAYASISPILDKAGQVKFYVGIERDITKEKQIDQAKSEFVSIASHQLRTPLSAIKWYSEMLIGGDAGEVNEEQMDFLKEIEKGSNRMVDLVDALLDVSRIELGTFSVEPKETNIIEMADDVIKELQPKIVDKKLKVKKIYGKDVPLMFVDPRLMRIVFQNLLSNAVKYTSNKGNVTLDIEKKKEKLSIKVSDTGLGIPKGNQEQIFTKLFRADNVRQSETEGTGLGLYIIKSIVENSKGKIWFDSEEGKGTNFYVELPITGMKKKTGIKKLGE
jgi:PAS domain S-box-containing protein